jgi:hypothetical protein
VLEPIDDTVERIAGVVFFVMTTTGVIGLAMGSVSAIGFRLPGLAALPSPTARGCNGSGADLVRLLGIRGCILALAVPFSFLSASLLADWMTAPVRAKQDAILADITGEVAREVQGAVSTAGGICRKTRSATESSRPASTTAPTNSWRASLQSWPCS